jgi:Type II secretion system (T2SS), protein E, N-terminal domain
MAMKLGELLLRERRITESQLEEALQLGRRFGLRVGSCLVELGYLDVDTLARALSAQHRVPAVLTKHVAAIAPEVIAILSSRIARELHAIPLGHTQTTPRRLVVALRDPGTTPVEELAFAAGTRLDVGVAPEILIRRCLEQYYGVKDEGSAMRLAIGSVNEDIGDSWPPTTAPVAGTAVMASVSSANRPAVPPRTLSVPPPPVGADQDSEQLDEEQIARAELTYAQIEEARLEMASEDEDVVSLEAVPISPTSSQGEPSEGSEREERLVEPSASPADGWDDVFGAPKRPSAPPRPLTAPPGAIRPVLDADETIEALRRANTREEIGETLTTWLQSEYGCGLVLIVKENTALGWKGYAPDAEQDLVESIAMPLGPPSMLNTAYEQRAPFCGPPPLEGMTLQTRLWKLLRCKPPNVVLVAPVVLGSRVVNLLYAHTDGILASTAAEDAARIASAASTEYARLIRKKK